MKIREIVFDCNQPRRWRASGPQQARPSGKQTVVVSAEDNDQLEVDEVYPTRAGAVIPCLVKAFWDYSETCHLLPNEATRRRVLPRYLGSDVHDSAALGALWAARQGGRVVGAAAWVPPGAYPVGLLRQFREAAHLAPIAPWGIAAVAEARRGQAANRSHHRTFPPHHWLRAIGVDPDRHGHGIGTQLMVRGLERADSQGSGCFLFTATAANVQWYSAFGFEEVASYRPTPTWPTTWALWRPPHR